MVAKGQSTTNANRSIYIRHYVIYQETKHKSIYIIQWLFIRNLYVKCKHSVNRWEDCDTTGHIVTLQEITKNNEHTMQGGMMGESVVKIPELEMME